MQNVGWLRQLCTVVPLIALFATLVGCGGNLLTASVLKGTVPTGTVLTAGSKFEDHDLVRLVLLDDARQTEQRCVAANGVRSSEGCMAAFLRRDGAIGVVAWLTRTMPTEEYQRALPLWCESLAMVQGLSRDQCRIRMAETSESALPSGAVHPNVSTIKVGPVSNGHLFTLALGGSAGVQKSENPVERIRVDLPTRVPDSPAWQVVAQEWCHSIAHAEWQLIRRDPCHGGSDEIRVNMALLDAPLGWNPARLPWCMGWVNQFCDPAVLTRR